MNLERHQSTATRRVSKIARSATLAVIALSFAAACTSPAPGGSVGTKTSPAASSSATPTPSPSTSTSPSPATVVTPAPPKPGPPPLGWPRPGWSSQTLGFSGISVWIPDTWYFDNNEVGLWTDGTAKVFCDAWRDPQLLFPEGPNVIDLANSRWNTTFGHGAAANAYGFQTFYGGNVWGADVTLGDGKTVEPRAFVLKGDVWIECGAIIRGTTSTAPEFHDIIDSIQILDPGVMQVQSYMENP